MTESLPELATRQMISGYWTSQMIYVCAKLRIADQLASGPKTSAELAATCGAHERSLYRLLRALAAMEIFEEAAEGRFSLTPMSECLRSDIAGSQHAVALMLGGDHYRAWGDLLYSIQTGGCAFEHAFGEGVFDYLTKHPDEGRIFDAAMTGIHGRESSAMLDAYDFSGIEHLIDIGGGNGSLLASALRKYPNLRGTLFDLPQVADRARANLTIPDLAGRATVTSGDFFEAVPAGADAYLMRHIIHDWDDKRSLQILRNCRQAVRSDGRLLLVEIVITPGQESLFGKLLDVNMLVVPGGQERTEPEYRELLAAAGFELTRIVPTRADVSIIEGRPI